ncbi:methionine--tRNA ligase [Mycoplasmopsis meleagridis]|uniref:methionine--tRNA ligase n=1 Tax=Mycoplasmopsis meleagridis TaxID=29561 RepID=UPI00073D256E|nr:methionine--tRNA ligase [Mycoplasmopsis meleagridis]KUH47610.1 methionine--tRNA ligase [Mycoplasmopsis meleagridis]
MKTKPTFFITTPIYYASGNLHIGHLYCTIMTWIIKNYKKSQGYDVKFLTGSDEHGQKIANKAKINNLNPKEFVDKLINSYKEMWKDWNIDFDYFSRTTNSFHEETIKDIFSFFLNKKLIYKGKYEGLYSVEDEEYLTKNQAIEKNNEYFHPSSGHKLIKMSEESYFFSISKMQKWWEEYIKNHPSFLLPNKTVNELINNFVSHGLEDLSVTRNNVPWAIPIREDNKHTIYVWLDALFNYITALGYNINDENSSDYLKYWKNGDEIVHVLGKEIARFHFIYWPIFIHSIGIKQPTHIISHGLLRDKDGRKMSKSLNNVIAPEELLNNYHDEMIKYYFASQIIFGEDGNFSEEHLKNTINSDLVNNFGNLISRTLKMINNNFLNGLFYKQASNQIDKNIEEEILNFDKKYSLLMNEFKIDKGLKEAINLSDKLNKYIDLTQPWKLTNNLEKLEQILIRLLNGIYTVSYALQICLPKKMQEVASVLNIDSFEKNQLSNLNKFDGKKTADKYLLFNRIK